MYKMEKIENVQQNNTLTFSQLQLFSQKQNDLYQKDIYQMQRRFANSILSPQMLTMTQQPQPINVLNFQYQDFGIINHQENNCFLEKTQLLQNFIQQKVVKNCEQRTEQWYTVRKTSFGGSEMANLMGNCKKNYKQQKVFLAEKMDNMMGKKQEMIPLQGQLIMDWGTFFEPLHREVIEEIFKCQVSETSMCLGEGVLKGCHQSPDGLSVIRTDIFKQFVKYDHIVDQSIFDQDYISVLWEQKSPVLRTPIYGSVPDNYIGQVKLGLSVFNVCDIGCYSDSVFRICSIRQFTTSTYNSGIIKKKRSETKDFDPLFIGFIILDEDSRLAIQQQLGDISLSITDAIFAHIMNLVRENKFKVSYEIHKYEDTIEFQKFIKNKSQLLSKTNSFICWKLVNLNFTAVERSTGFQNIMSIFVSIGRNILQEFQKKQLLPSKQMENIQVFTQLIKKLNMPMSPENRQDMWYQANKKQILKQFEDIFQDDWQSFYVLISLLLNSEEEQLKLKSLKYVQDAVDVCIQHEDKSQQLIQILEQFDGEYQQYIVELKKKTQKQNIDLQDLQTQQNQLTNQLLEQQNVEMLDESQQI